MSAIKILGIMLIRMINSMFVEITEALEHLVHSFGILPVKAEWEPTIKQAKELIRNKFQVFMGLTKNSLMLVTDFYKNLSAMTTVTNFSSSTLDYSPSLILIYQFKYCHHSNINVILT